MRSSTTFLAAAAALISFTAATPLERRYQECRAPQQWHVCGDGWAGCCSVSPCKGPAIASGCPDEGATNPPSSSTTPPSPTVSDSSAPSCSSAAPKPDTAWQKACKEDDSACNWAPNHWSIKTYDEEYSSNSTRQFYAFKDEGDDAARRDVIAVFEVPESVKKCELRWYNPASGTYYGTFGDGSFNISILDTGDKKLEEAVGGTINYKNVKEILKNGQASGALDLGNWQSSSTPYNGLGNAREIDCSKSELAIHFAMIAKSGGSHISDQIAKGDGLVTRAGWFLQYRS
ncbi:hypothetical protein N0V90_004811 [Kalmusia sp. IMI 367209]|nr:hypothetical protein N0V90_004811 [Kalmusia sp. IMI 367209]